MRWRELCRKNVYRYGLSIESDGVHDISFARIAVNSYGLVVIGYVGAIQGWVDLDCSGVEVRELIRESDIPWSVRIDLFGIRLGVVFYDLECRDRLEGERESIFGGQGTFGRWNLIGSLGREGAMSEIDWLLDESAYVGANGNSDCGVSRQQLGRFHGNPIALSFAALCILCKRRLLHLLVRHQAQRCIGCVEYPSFQEN